MHRVRGVETVETFIVHAQIGTIQEGVFVFVMAILVDSDRLRPNSADNISQSSIDFIFRNESDFVGDDNKCAASN